MVMAALEALRALRVIPARQVMQVTPVTMGQAVLVARLARLEIPVAQATPVIRAPMVPEVQVVRLA
jgi:hypothetical protein